MADNWDQFPLVADVASGNGWDAFPLVESPKISTPPPPPNRIQGATPPAALKQEIEAAVLAGASPEMSRKQKLIDLRAQLQKLRDGGGERPGYLAELGAGAGRGFKNLQAAAGELGAIYSHGTPWEKPFAESAQEFRDEARRIPASVSRLGEIHNLRDLAYFGTAALGEQVPNIALTMGGGGLGALAAVRAGGKAAQTALGTGLGATAGSAPIGIGQEIGAISGAIREQTGKTAPITSVAFGTLAGLLEVIPEASLLTRVFRGNLGGKLATKLGNNLVARMGVEGTRQALAEAGTEGLQTIVERTAVHMKDPKYAVFSDEGWEDIFTSMLAGTLVGGFVGSVTSGLSGKPDTQEADREEEAKRRVKAAWKDISTEMAERPKENGTLVRDLVTGQPIDTGKAPPTPAKVNETTGAVEIASTPTATTPPPIPAGRPALDVVALAKKLKQVQKAEPQGSEAPAASVATSAITPAVQPSLPKIETPKSSTQLTLKAGDADPFISLARSIPDHDIYSKPDATGKDDYGRETEPHITALYGLTEHTPAPVAQVIRDAGPITVTLGKTSIFKGDDYDVLKVDVEGESLRELNKKLSRLPNENKFPDYKPHLTIAYLKKGTGDKYVGNTAFEGKQITFDTVTFSPPPELRTTTGRAVLPLTPMLAQPVTTPEVAPPVSKFKLPSELSKSAPRYKTFKLKFDSDYDRTAYILANDAAKGETSKSAKAFRDALVTSGLDVATAEAHGRRVIAAIKAQEPVALRDGLEEITVPPLQKGGEPAPAPGPKTEPVPGPKTEPKLISRTEPGSWGASNKLVTQDQADAIRAKLREKLKQLNVGVDPEFLALGTQLAVYHVEAGARKFSDFTKRMVDDLGEKVRPYLPSWYLAARNWPGIDKTGMDSEADIDAQPQPETQTSVQVPAPAQTPTPAPAPVQEPKPEPEATTQAADVQVVLLSPKLNWHGTIKTWHKTALGYFKRVLQGKVATNEATQLPIRISRDGIEKTLFQARNLEDFQAVESLTALLEKAVLVESNPPRDGDPNIKAFHRFYAPLSIGDKLFRVKLTVKESVLRGAKYYEHVLTEIEKPAGIKVALAGEREPAHEATVAAGKIKVTDLLQGVKVTSKDDKKTAASSPEETPRFSLSKENASGEMAEAAARSVAGAFAVENPTAPRVRVVNDPAMAEQGVPVQGYFDDETGEMVVNAATIPDEATLREVLREEWAHALLASPEGRREVQRFAQSRMTEADRRALQALYRRRLRESAGHYDERLADEFIAKAWREQLPWWRELMERVRTWLASKGIGSLDSEQIARAVVRRRVKEESGIIVIQNSGSDKPGLLSSEGAVTSVYATDPITGRPTLIKGSRISEETRSALSAAAERWRHWGNTQGQRSHALRGDAEEIYGSPQSELRPTLELFGISSESVRSVTDWNSRNRLVESTKLTKISDAGGEALVFADLPNGTVYKFYFPYRDGSIGAGLIPTLKDGGVAPGFRSVLSTITDKVYLLNLIGGVPTEFLGVTSEGVAIAKQPLSTNANVDDAARFVEMGTLGLEPLPDTMVRSPLAVAYFVGVVNDQAWLITDFQRGNFVQDNAGNARLADPIGGVIPESVADGVQGLKELIKRAAEQSRSRPVRRFSLASIKSGRDFDQATASADEMVPDDARWNAVAGHAEATLAAGMLKDRYDGLPAEVKAYLPMVSGRLAAMKKSRTTLGRDFNMPAGDLHAVATALSEGVQHRYTDVVFRAAVNILDLVDSAQAFLKQLSRERAEFVLLEKNEQAKSKRERTVDLAKSVLNIRRGQLLQMQAQAQATGNAVTESKAKSLLAGLENIEEALANVAARLAQDGDEALGKLTPQTAGASQEVIEVFKAVMERDGEKVRAMLQSLRAGADSPALAAARERLKLREQAGAFLDAALKDPGFKRNWEQAVSLTGSQAILQKRSEDGELIFVNPDNPRETVTISNGYSERDFEQNMGSFSTALGWFEDYLAKPEADPLLAAGARKQIEAIEQVHINQQFDPKAGKLVGGGASEWLIRFTGGILDTPEHVLDMAGGRASAEAYRELQNYSNARNLVAQAHAKHKAKAINTARVAAKAHGMTDPLEWKDRLGDAILGSYQNPGDVKLRKGMSHRGLEITTLDMDAVQAQKEYADGIMAAMRTLLTATETGRQSPILIRDRVGDTLLERTAQDPSGMTVPQRLKESALAFVQAWEATAGNATEQMDLLNNPVYLNAALLSHVESFSNPSYRQQFQDSPFRETYGTIAKEWRANGNLPGSLDELVSLLAERTSIAEESVRETLLGEVNHYVKRFSDDEGKAVQLEDTADVEVIHAKNFLNRPRGKRILPAGFYEYTAPDSESQNSLQNAPLEIYAQRFINRLSDLLKSLKKQKAGFDVRVNYDPAAEKAIAAEQKRGKNLTNYTELGRLIPMVERSISRFREHVKRRQTTELDMLSGLQMTRGVLATSMLQAVGTLSANATGPGVQRVVLDEAMGTGASLLAQVPLVRPIVVSAKSLYNVGLSAVGTLIRGLSLGQWKNERIQSAVRELQTNESWWAKVLGYAIYKMQLDRAAQEKSLALGVVDRDPWRENLQLVSGSMFLEGGQFTRNNKRGRIRKGVDSLATWFIETGGGIQLPRALASALIDRRINEMATADAQGMVDGVKEAAASNAAALAQLQPTSLLTPAQADADSETTLAQRRQFFSKAGINLDRVMIEYARELQSLPPGADKRDVTLLTEPQMNSLVIEAAKWMNKGMFSNRPFYNSQVSALLGLFMGYSIGQHSMLARTLAHSSRETRGKVRMAARDFKLLSGAAIGMIAMGVPAALVGEWVRRKLFREESQIRPLSEARNAKDLAKSLYEMSGRHIPLVGNLLTSVSGSVLPTAKFGQAGTFRLLPVSIGEDISDVILKSVQTGSPRRPLAEFVRRYFPNSRIWINQSEMREGVTNEAMMRAALVRYAPEGVEVRMGFGGGGGARRYSPATAEIDNVANALSATNGTPNWELVESERAKGIAKLVKSGVADEDEAAKRFDRAVLARNPYKSVYGRELSETERSEVLKQLTPELKTVFDTVEAGRQGYAERFGRSAPDFVREERRSGGGGGGPGNIGPIMAGGSTSRSSQGGYASFRRGSSGGSPASAGGGGSAGGYALSSGSGMVGVRRGRRLGGGRRLRGGRGGGRLRRGRRIRLRGLRTRRLGSIRRRRRLRLAA